MSTAPSVARARLLAMLPLIAFEVAVASFAIVRIRGTEAAPPVVATVRSAQAAADAIHRGVGIRHSATGVDRMVALEAPPHPD